MSGQAGASREERFFLVEYTSGINVNVATPTWEKNPAEYVSRRFEESSRPYEKRLQRVIHALNSYFTDLASSDAFPIVEYRGKRDWIYGVVIEDTNPSRKNEEDELHGKTWLRNAPERAAYVKLSISLEQQGFERVSLTFAIHKPILRSQIAQIEKQVLEIFKKDVDGRAP